MRRDGELVKFCNEIKSVKDLKEAIGNDSAYVMGDLHKSSSHEGVEGCM